MAEKIGRNDKCPCGSGKKFKHCCLKKGTIYTHQDTSESPKASHNIRNEFSKFHSTDLIATLACISINPLNHGKNLRIEYLILEALASYNDSKELISVNKLKEIIDEFLPFHQLEDPPENLFTENIPFTNGNNIVYGGNFHQGAFILNAQISALQFNSELFPQEFMKLINSAFISLLTISDIIAKRFGHQRNMIGGYGETGTEIEIQENIEDYKLSLFFSNDWLIEHNYLFKIDENIIRLFCLDRHEFETKTYDIADRDIPLITKPIIKLSTGILVVSPASIISALIHFVWVQSEIFGCKESLIKEFHKYIWRESMFFLNKIDFKKVPFKFQDESTLPIKSSLFKVDTDKLAYLSFIYDNGDSYQHSTPCHAVPLENIEEIRQIQETNLKSLQETYPNNKILDLTIYSSIGREYMLMVPNREDVFVLTTSMHDFLSWIKCDNHEKMSFWYFIESLYKFENSREFHFSFSGFNDKYEYYRKHNQSFYLGDDAPPGSFALFSDGSLEIFKDAVAKEDRIVVHYWSEELGQTVLIPVIKFSDYVPRYFSTNSIGRQLEYYIPNFSIDIWLRAKNNADEIEKKHFSLFWDFSEAISYWLWQVSDLLDEHIKPLKIFSLLIVYDLLDIENFEDEGLLGQKNHVLSDSFIINVDAKIINIGIPKLIYGFVSSPDNEGERVLLAKILTAFGLLLKKNELTNTLTNQEIEKILEIKAPIGLKKMLIAVHSGNNIALDPRNIVQPRYLQESRRQWYMDLTTVLLGDKCPKVGEIVSKEEKERLAKDIVFALLNELKKIANNYNSIEAINWYMANYESILHENALSRLRTPTRLHCFAEQEDIVNEIQEKSKNSDETSLACRCLIEHFAAEPSYGSSTLNLMALDDMIAIMSLIIHWGGIGDQIKYELFKVDLAILPSKRIGTNSKERSDAFFNKFSETRAKEYIEDSTEEFSSLYEQDSAPKRNASESFENAFYNEFGIRFEKLGGIIQLLIHIGTEQNETIAKLSIKEVISLVKSSFEENFEEDEITSAIKFLCLWNREEVTKIPVGFSSIDISPWRYNRKLSYLQRPIILVDYGDEKSDPKIFWTPRHLDQSWKYLNHLVLSGRFRSPEKSEMERQVSKISKDRGAVLQEKVITWLESIGIKDLYQEVTISPSGALKHPKDLGDIDVLAIDHKNNVVLSIECKRTEQARNGKEMVEQVEQYYGRGSKKGYFERHINRHAWLNENIEEVSSFCKKEISSYSILSFFITYDILAIQFMTDKPLPIPVYSLFDLKNTLYDKIVEQLTGFYQIPDVTNHKHELQGAAGSLRVNLAWNTKDDLDLWVETPGGKIFYENKKVDYENSVGELDIDANGNSPYVSNPQENIFWDTIPNGKHKVRVNFFACRDKSEVPFSLSIIPQIGKGKVYKGNINFNKQRIIDVADFEIVNGCLEVIDLL